MLPNHRHKPTINQYLPLAHDGDHVITREVLDIKLENPNSEIIRQMNRATLASAPALGS